MTVHDSRLNPSPIAPRVQKMNETTISGLASEISPPSPRRSGRERIMTVAGDLFYQNGIVSVGVDRIIEDAGVAKATLYKNFRSKENLIDAYLESQHKDISSSLEAIAIKNVSAMEKIHAIFDFLQARSAEHPYRGCPFILAFAEFPHPAAIANQWAQRHKGYVRSLFSQLAPQLVPHSAIETMVEQLMVLYEGALITSAIHPHSSAIQHARNMVSHMVRAHGENGGQSTSSMTSGTPLAAQPLPVMTV